MKKLSLAASLLAAGLYFSPTPAQAEDISKHWAYDEMRYLIDNQIMYGDEFGNYLPNNNVSRAEFAAFLVRALELPAVSTPANFHDVHERDWYYDAVNQASYYNLVAGDEKGNFNPKAKIDRQQMAVMLHNAIVYLGRESTPTSLTFNDNNKIANWAYDKVQHIVGLNIIVGKPNNTFAPLAVATRAEAASVIYRVLNPDVVPEKPVVGSVVHTSTSYNQSFTDVLPKQANNIPKVDGSGLFVATKELVAYYLNPNSFAQNSVEYYQFLKLSTPITNLDARVIDEKVLSGKGILANTAKAFIDAGIKYDINAIYLISHALHETGNGKSALATGIEVGLNASGQPEMVTEENRASLTNIKKTYNVYGIDAKDANPNKLGAERAYKDGWFTINDAIIGGAKFVKEKYIGIGQDTLYKMRWNPDNPPVHQYATHVQWAIIQARKIQDIYAITGADKTTKMIFDVPRYQSQPSTSPLPAPENQYALMTSLKGAIGKVTADNLKLRTYPSTAVSSNIIDQLAMDTKVTVIGHNGPWYRVSVNGKEGWVSGDYVSFLNILTVAEIDTPLNVRSEPTTASSILGSVKAKSKLIGVLDENDQLVQEDIWYQVYYNGGTGWVSGDYIMK
ncbi:S-layer homology domain-containing protein [Lysinibacillus sp. BW-2-10]|uniref:S-layer homology domain-containing protein n=1 Tax=Lysinibacillus sp. BW-2-10 TaxID=2590030 RepID=UPI00117EE228|nr:S-layer homology domain-containing protein [Lysinibacillus sp. BW-2-10]TSI07376.1 SH3 domain-containing protein [Lysinibacillus sp. BW-2-10]